jgi:hypothetical protein
MNKTVSYCALIVVAGLLAGITILQPNLLSDSNAFLKEFSGANLLLVTGVILTITLASGGQIHLSLNEIESKIGRTFLSKTRNGVHGSSYWMMSLFLVAAVIAIMKPYSDALRWQAFFNSAALLILLWMVLIMVSLTRLIFTIKPQFDDTTPHI